MPASLLPPNVSPLERALERSMAFYGDVDEREIPIARLWRPRECPIALLPWLAWALGVKRWDPDWPVETRRRVIEIAVETHRHRGTLAAVREALDTVGGIYEITERPDDAVHTIGITLRNANALVGSSTVRAIRAYIDDAKRFSTHYTLVLGSALDSSGVSIAGGAAGAVIAQLSLTVDEGAA